VAKIGIICPDLSGHLNPMMALARELEGRGHRALFYARLIAQKKIEEAGFAFRPYGEKEFSVEETKRQLRVLAEMNGLAAMKYTVEVLRIRTVACLRDVPSMARRDGVEALVVDQTTPEGATVAEELGIPYATACNALMLQPNDAVPPFCFTWRYRDAWWARVRNRWANKLIQRIARPLVEAVNDYRREMKLKPYAGMWEATSPALMITQQPRAFEFPREDLPPQVYFAGPLTDSAVREAVEFPFERLDGRPLIYASMGTMQNRMFEVFEKIAGACAGLGAQLVISLGGGSAADAVGKLPGDPIVVPFAPQLQLLKRARLCVTHAGLNTALESLACGVPMVAIPVTNDQPGVAARVAWTGSGELVGLKRLKVARLRRAVEKVLGDGSYAHNAGRLRDAIARCGGVRGAADQVEREVLGNKNGVGRVPHADAVNALGLALPAHDQECDGHRLEDQREEKIVVQGFGVVAAVEVGEEQCREDDHLHDAGEEF
jgi:MGT family glycosyltransferase